MRDHFGTVLDADDSVLYHDRDGSVLPAAVVGEAANGRCLLRLVRVHRLHGELFDAAPQVFEADAADLTYVIARSDRSPSTPLSTVLPRE